ncbi:MAG: ATP-dependent metallopeptidase FtsH/Yme1/Tma family protein [Sulfurimonas sp.]|nr:MAG: ATP-dependent metallopeptidase FtsH/Yme1/Tma family protein [Sulfurimonas sp.]
MVSATILLSLFAYAFLRDTAELIPLEGAQELLKEKLVHKVTASENYMYLKTDTGVYKLATSQVNPKMFSDIPVSVDTSSNIALNILYLILLLMTFSILFRQWQKGTQHNAGSESGTRAYLPENQTQEIVPVMSDVSFSDIGGISDVKIELEEIIDFLKNPVKYINYGVYLPRGVLLVGPPGVGKTMIAKAVAAEADVPFYYQSGASFVQIYVGMGAKRVHDLFTEAKNNAPSIIFIDEIDAVGKTREGSRNDEREATLNQLLTEMDGFEDSSGVIVLAATNKIDVLDSALLRSGRFDRRIFVDLPTPSERESILLKYLKKIPHNVDAAQIAKMTMGFNGASLAALVNEAALLSMRQHDLHVTDEHFNLVKDKVLLGKKRVPVLTHEQRQYRARYQAAKGFVATWYDIAFDKVLLSSAAIKPPVDAPMLHHEMVAHIKMLLAGMAACNIHFNEHDSSVEADIGDAKRLVSQMIERYAMGETIMGSEHDCAQLIETLYAETVVLLRKNKLCIEKVEAILMQYESISKALLQEIINEVL